MSLIRIDVPASDATGAPPESIMSGRNPRGDVLGVSSHSLLWNGKPWFPIMGELHFSRCPRQFWDESILKTLAGGVGIISTYVFWIHHEEEEGVFAWSGDRDLRRFLTLCAARGCKVFLRIGPWCHGECRNGGFPDWLLAKQLEPRTNDERYLALVRRYFEEIFRQARGLLFKDGGPIIGIQLENEYGHVGGRRGAEAEAHMMALKRMAGAIGFDVPLYTATGWGGAVVVRGEFVPVMSAYADAPWTRHTDPLPPNGNFRFSSDRDDLQVGSDAALPGLDDPARTWEGQPYLMAELGAGIMATGHRRPVVTAQDSEAMALVKLGSGANLLGYYMYHGGSNPRGKLSTLQESRATGSPNDLPVISYDFQTAIREFGQVSNTCRHLKVLHLFLNDFGGTVARMRAVVPDPGSGVRYAFRRAGDGGFLFVNNHQRGYPLPGQKRLQFALETDGRTLRFPAFDLATGRFLIFPFNFRIGGLVLQYATVQLLCRTELDGEEWLFFFSYPEIPPVYSFIAGSVEAVSTDRGRVKSQDGSVLVTGLRPGTDSLVRVRCRDGRRTAIVTLTRKQAEMCWKGRVAGRERIFLSEADLQFPDDALRLVSAEAGRLGFSVFPAAGFIDQPLARGFRSGNDGVFARHELTMSSPWIAVSAVRLRSTSPDLGEWEIRMPDNAAMDCNDVFLCLDFAGERAELLIGEAVVADCFATGLTWEIGLKRFQNLPGSSQLGLRIRELQEDAPIYFDRRPRFVRGRALRLVRVRAWRQSSITVSP